MNQLLTTTYRRTSFHRNMYICICIYAVSSLGLARPGHRPVPSVMRGLIPLKRNHLEPNARLKSIAAVHSHTAYIRIIIVRTIPTRSNLVHTGTSHRRVVSLIVSTLYLRFLRARNRTYRHEAASCLSILSFTE